MFFKLTLTTKQLLKQRTMKRWYSNFKKDGVKGLANKPRGMSQPVDNEIKQKIKDIKLKTEVEVEERLETF